LGYTQNFQSKNFGTKERKYSGYEAIFRLNNQLSRAISDYYRFLASQEAIAVAADLSRDYSWAIAGQ
jgi:hypothetical protein